MHRYRLPFPHPLLPGSWLSPDFRTANTSPCLPPYRKKPETIKQKPPFERLLFSDEGGTGMKEPIYTATLQHITGPDRPAEVALRVTGCSRLEGIFAVFGVI